VSNPKPIEQARTADLRNSRAAQRAREVAVQTGTALVVYREGKLLLLDASAGGPVKD
jgi:hypothetical protein